MSTIKVRITLIEDLLGTASNNPDIHKEHIAENSKDADKVKEELQALPADELMEKSLTVFPRDMDGMPILWDYQLKGFLKDAIALLSELSDKEIKVGKTKLSKYTVKRIVDNYVFVAPRKIRLAHVSGICTRPLRAVTMQGERVALASSEVVPAGTKFEAAMSTMSPALDELVKNSLDYGVNKGIGQWRNSGKGRFTWEEMA